MPERTYKETVLWGLLTNDERRSKVTCGDEPIHLFLTDREAGWLTDALQAWEGPYSEADPKTMTEREVFWRTSARKWTEEAVDQIASLLVERAERQGGDR